MIMYNVCARTTWATDRNDRLKGSDDYSNPHPWDIKSVINIILVSDTLMRHVLMSRYR